ncbi:MAG: hypothetical protein ABR555_08040 [Pyrinomonadaceae bacterium]
MPAPERSQVQNNPVTPTATVPAPSPSEVVMAPALAGNGGKHNEVSRKAKPYRTTPLTFSAQNQSVATRDFSNLAAPVVGSSRLVNNGNTVFPIEATHQSLKLSLDDGRGMSRTISLPPVSFGSQRVLASGSVSGQFRPQGVW